MLIGELSHQTGVSVRMLRYYERQALLRPARTAAGYRTYTNGDVVTVQRIVLLNAAGLCLAAIRGLLPCALPGAPGFTPCRALRARVQERLSALDRQLAQLRQSRTLLVSFLNAASQSISRADEKRY